MSHKREDKKSIVDTRKVQELEKTDQETPDVVLRVREKVVEAQVFSGILQTDIDKLSLDESDEAKAARQQLKKLQAEMQTTESSMWRELSNILSRPIDVVRDFFANRKDRTLKIPDNPQTISKLKSEVRKITDLYSRLKKKHAKDSTGPSDGKLAFDNKELVRSLEEATRLAAQAAKNDLKLWDETQADLDQLNTLRMNALVSEGKISEAADVWSALSDKKQDEQGSILAKKIFKCQIDAKYINPIPDKAIPNDRGFDIFEQQRRFNMWQVEVGQIIAPPYLRTAVEQLGKKWFLSMVEPRYKFLLEKPEVCAEALSKLDKDVADKVLEDWFMDKYDWETILLLPDAFEVATLLKKFPVIKNSLKAKQLIFFLEKFPVDEVSNAFEKITTLYPSYARLTEAALEGAVIVANLDHFEINIFKTLDSIKLEAIGALSRVSTRANLETLLSAENLVDFGDISASFIFRTQKDSEILSQSISPLAAEFFRNSPNNNWGYVLTGASGRNIEAYKGIQGRTTEYLNFCNFLDQISEPERDYLLSSIKPSLRGSYNTNLVIPVGAIKNFIDYHTEVSDDLPLAYEDFIDQIGRFEPQNFEAIKKGVAIFQEADLLEKIKSTDYVLTLLELAGKAIDQNINTLIKKFISNNEKVVYERNYGYRNSEFVTRERNRNDLEEIYNFAKEYERVFAQDPANICEFLGLSTFETKVVFAYRSLDLTSQDYIDLPAIEGSLKNILIKIGNAKVDFEKFLTLDGEQRKNWLKLKKFFSYEQDRIFDKIQNGEAEIILECVNELGFVPSRIDIALPIARSKNRGFFQYFKDILISGYFNDQSILKLSQKCDELFDAGMPKYYFENRVIPSEKQIDNGIERFLSVPAGFIAMALRILERYDFEIKLGNVCYLNSAETEKEFEYRVRYFKMVGEDSVYDYPLEQDQDENILKLGEERRARLEIICPGIKVRGRGIFKVMALDESDWQELQANVDVLKLFLESRWSKFPGFNLSLEVLNNPLFWKFEVDQDVYTNPYVLARHLNFVTNFVTNKEGWATKFREPVSLEQWIKLYDSIELVSRLLGEDVVRGVNFDILEKAIKMDSNELEKFKNFINIFSVTGTEVHVWHYEKDFDLFKNLSPEYIAKLQEMNEVCNNKLPLNLITQLIEPIKIGTITEIVANLDEELSGYAIGSHQWTEYRFGGVKVDLSKYPKLQEIYRRSYSYIDNCSSVIDALNSCDDAALQNLERLVTQTKDQSRSQMPFSYPKESTIFIAKHSNFENILKFVQTDGLDSMVAYLPFLDRDSLRDFCENIDGDDILNIKEAVDSAEIGLKEVSLLLRFREDMSKFIVFSQKMHEIFGEKISIYDFYLMDTGRIEKTLNYIRKHCLSDISKEDLRRILTFSKGDIAQQISLVLASFDNRQTIAVDMTLDRLVSAPAEFQWAILKNKVENFGWDLLNHTDRLYKLGLSEAQLDELWTSLLGSFGAPKQVIDSRTTEILLKCGKKVSGGNVALITHIFRNHAEPLESYRSIFVENKDAFLTAMNNRWGTLPDEIKSDSQYLQMLMEEKFDAFFGHFIEIKDDFIAVQTKYIYNKVLESGPKASSVFLMATKERGIQLSDMEISQLVEIIKSNAQYSHDVLLKADSGGIILSIEDEGVLIDAFISSPNTILPDKNLGDATLSSKMLQKADLAVQNWKNDPVKSITVLSKLLRQNIFESSHLDILHAMVMEKDWESSGASAKDIHMVFINYLITVDPTIKETINNEKKLGKLKNIVINKIIEYVQSLSADGEISQNNLQIKIRKKLQEISRLFGSSQTKESDKRLVFMDMYNLKDCRDPAVKELTEEEVAKILKRDVESVVLLSGSEIQIQNLQRELELTDDPELKQAIAGQIARSKEALNKADARNRATIDFLPPGALTHGISSQHIGLALEYGNLSGELLGPDTKRDSSGLLGVDVSRVIGEDVESKSFLERYQTLMNYGYGDVLLVYGEYKEEDRPPYFSGAIGKDHYLVRAGIPTSEVTAIILRKNELLSQMKKDVATKGIYIPLVDIEGNILFSAEEFDKMKVFYNSLNKRGYPRAVIDNVYDYIASSKGEKHQIVIDVAVAYIQKNESAIIDLAVLVDFLRSNDLNEREADWYKSQPFEALYDFIKKTVGRKKRKKARAMMFGSDFANAFERRVIHKEEIAVSPDRQRNAFVDAFFDKQLPFVYNDVQKVERQAMFEDDMTSMLFREKSAKFTLEIADRFSKFKKEFMGKLWESAWDTMLAQTTEEQKAVLGDYKKYIVPAVVGSVGRGEVVLGSDLDYLLYVDNVSQELSSEQLDNLKNFINSKLGPAMNQLLEENGIHADAGLAKADRQPFTLLSTVRDFKIDLTLQRQAEEPTTIIDSEALFVDQSSVVEKAKEMLLVENESSYYLDSYIAKDLEFGSGNHPGYQEQFEKLYNSVASGDLISRVKESLQRAVTFKLYYLIFEGLNSDKIPKSMSKDIPASIVGKIDLLEKNKILSKQEGGVCSELAALAYKLRFVGEVYSNEAKQDKRLADKVKNVTFKLDDISYDERVKLVGLLKEFKATILYK